ncbi:MAG: hypothetical protein QM759_13800 [Terricaulis sp.]
MRYRATWIDAGHPLYHEAETADAIIEWGERMLSNQISVVWVATMQDPDERVPLAEFKRTASCDPRL